MPKPTSTYDFVTALSALQHGQRITRAGWNGAAQYVTRILSASAVLRTDPFERRRYEPTAGREESIRESRVELEPFLVLRNAEGRFVPWTPTAGDLLATDWHGV